MRRTETTPNGKRTFLGSFKSDSLRFSLSNLPPHQFVRVRFDLLVINHWDGSYYGAGPQIWQIRMTDGPVLLYTTFSTCELRNNSYQAFPDQYPHHLYPPYTGASEKKTLGYSYDLTAEYRAVKMDSVYSFSFDVPHRQQDLKLEIGFTAKGKAEVAAWGLDNFSVSVLDSPRSLDLQEMQSLWMKLSGRDPVQAFVAKWAFIAAGGQAADFLRQKLEKLEPDRVLVRKLLADLESTSAERRDAAQKKLQDLDPGALPALVEAMNRTHSPEVQFRLAPAIAMLKSLNAIKPTQDSVPVSARVEHILQVLGAWEDWTPQEEEPAADLDKDPPANQ